MCKEPAYDCPNRCGLRFAFMLEHLKHCKGVAGTHSRTANAIKPRKAKRVVA